MKQTTILTRTDLPLCSWKKEVFIDRLNSSFSGLKELRQYKEDGSCGVIHIYIRVGLSARGHLLAALLSLGIANLAVEGNICGGQSVHKFFNARTGEFIGHSKKDAAQVLIRIAQKLYRQGSYSDAREYADNACQYSEDIYFRDKSFRNWRDHAVEFLKKGAEPELIQNEHDDSFHQIQLPIDSAQYQGPRPQLNADCTGGNTLPEEETEEVYEKARDAFEKGDYKAVIGLMNQVIPKCSESYSKKKTFFELKTQAQLKYAYESNNEEAEQLHRQALTLMSKGQHAAAKDICSQALNKCSHEYKRREEFENAKARAILIIRQGEIQQQNDIADGFYSSGMASLWRKEYADAIFNFGQAILKCTPEYVNRPLYCEKELEAQVALRRQDQERWRNQAAEELYNQGLFRLQGQDFSGAKHCFEQAYYKCSENYERKYLFSQERENAESEVAKQNKNSGWNRRRN